MQIRPPEEMRNLRGFDQDLLHDCDILPVHRVIRREKVLVQRAGGRTFAHPPAMGSENALRAGDKVLYILCPRPLFAHGANGDRGDVDQQKKDAKHGGLLVISR